MTEHNSFLLSAVESSADAIIALTPDGHIAYCNPAVEAIYGYSGQELIGRSVTCLSLPERADEIPLILNRILNGERVRHFQTIHLNKSGTSVPVSLSISPIINSAEQIVGASFISRDLSHQMSFKLTLHETAQRYEKLKTSLELAQHVQKRLLPCDAALTADLDICARTHYCEDLGGDYYDFFSLPGQKEKILRLAVGDVSGHGTAAALLMAMAKGALQAEIEHSPDNLVEVLRRLNRFFYQDTGSEGMFMTLFLARLDVRSMDLNWCSAGQGPVYVYHPQEQYFEELDSTGTPLGVLPDDAYSSRSKRLAPEDILIVGTDGLWEARNSQGEMFSIERFRQLLATWHHKTAAEICTQMLARVQSFTASQQLSDDISLVIVKIPPAPLLLASDLN